ncbi:MAG: M81 family metallopeptidase [Isosphaeraceae bacterium]
MVRIAIGGLMHESNTFASDVTELEGFQSGGLEVGPGIVARWGDAHHEVGGFLEAARSLGFTPVPTLMAWATPSGPVSRRAYEALVEQLTELLRDAGPLDAVLLALHGAMVVDGLDDADGTTLVRVREAVGPGCPLIATLDYHANVSELMASTADALIAYRTYPHIDQRQRGTKAGAIAWRAARGEIRPVVALRKPSMLIHLLAQDTGREPMRSIVASLDALDPDPRVLDVSVLAGFPYADTPATGASCLAVTDNDPVLAERVAETLKKRVWDARVALTANPPGPSEAVQEALRATQTPVVLVDLGDNIGGGSAADSTVLAHELRMQRATGSIVVVYDPLAATVCERAGVGGQVDIMVGGRIDRNAPPLSVRGQVITIHDGRYVEELPRHGGIRLNDQGLTAVVRTDGDNFVVVNSLRHPPFSLGQLTSLGIQPHDARIIVVKAAVAYKAAYEPIAGTIIAVDTPGLTTSNPERLPYRRLRRPILPLDPGSFLEASVP